MGVGRRGNRPNWTEEKEVDSRELRAEIRKNASAVAAPRGDGDWAQKLTP